MTSYYNGTVPSWVDRGCWKDDISRNLKINLITSTVQACKDLALKFGFDTILVEHNGGCWAGRGLDYTTLGTAESCSTEGFLTG